MSNFTKWLSKELNQRGWSHSELGRQSGISRALVSQVIAGDVSPSCDFCIKVAAALDASPVYILQIADILPADTKTLDTDNSIIQETAKVLNKLHPFYRDKILSHAKFLLANYGSNKK